MADLVSRCWVLAFFLKQTLFWPYRNQYSSTRLREESTSEQPLFLPRLPLSTPVNSDLRRLISFYLESLCSFIVISSAYALSNALHIGSLTLKKTSRRSATHDSCYVDVAKRKTAKLTSLPMESEIRRTPNVGVHTWFQVALVGMHRGLVKESTRLMQTRFP